MWKINSKSNKDISFRTVMKLKLVSYHISKRYFFYPNDNYDYNAIEKEINDLLLNNKSELHYPISTDNQEVVPYTNYTERLSQLHSCVEEMKEENATLEYKKTDFEPKLQLQSHTYTPIFLFILILIAITIYGYRQQLLDNQMYVISCVFTILVLSYIFYTYLFIKPN